MRFGHRSVTIRPGVNHVARLLLVVALAAPAVAGCDGSAPAPRPSPPSSVRLVWDPVALTGLAVGERAVIRTAVACSGRRFLTGAIVDGAGTPRPAVWASADARTFTPVEVRARSYYGRQNTIGLAACRDGRLAAIGAQVGGVHGFNRYSGWVADPTGVLTEIDEPYTLFAGPDGVNVARMVAGDQGWLLTGNRSTGAAAWVSADGAAWRLVDHDAVLGSGPDQQNWAADAAATPAGWVMVGARTSAGQRDPAVWTSTDGIVWRRLAVPGSPGFEDPQRVVVVGSQLVAVGPRGDGFAAWRGSIDGPWSLGGQFGGNGSGQGSVTSLTVAGLTAAGPMLFATVSDGAGFTGWASTDGGLTWRPVALPTSAPDRAGATTFAAGVPGGPLLLVVDDGRSTRAWLGAVAGS